MPRWIAAVCAVALLLVQAGPAVSQERRQRVTRYAGATRVETAVEISRLSYPDFPDCSGEGQEPDPSSDLARICSPSVPSATTAVLVRADDPADALVAAPLAKQRAGPVLLTSPERLHPATAEELKRLAGDPGIHQVVLLGGPQALPAEIEQEVRELGIEDVRRVAGADRYETAAMVARAMRSPERLGTQGGVIPSETGTALVATSSGEPSQEGWPDALSAASFASFARAPLLLVRRSTVPLATETVLGELGLERVVLVGGSAALSEDVESSLGALVGEVSRLGGASRYETSRLVADAVARPRS